MTLLIRSRRLAEQYDGPCAAAISITDPGSRPANLRTNNVLRLAFHDVGHGGADRVDMTGDDAQAVWQWVRAHPDGPILIHCEAGMSRSISMGKGIADAMGWPRSCLDWLYDNGPWAVPTRMEAQFGPANQRVYDLVRANGAREG